MTFIKLKTAILTLIFTIFLSQTALAHPSTPTPQGYAGESQLLVKVHTSCHYWKHECYYGRGFDRHSYRQCLKRKGCYSNSYRSHRRGWRPSRNYHYSRRNNCSIWHRRCRRNWGGYSNYRGCMQYHGCRPRYSRPKPHYYHGY